MSSFQESYARVTENMGGIAGTFESSEYVSKVQKAVDDAIGALRREAARRRNVSEDYLKGWLAEQWHPETLKVSAAARGRNDVWARALGTNRPGEDVHYGDSTVSEVAEIKYHKDGEKTAKVISEPKYVGRVKVVPIDQKEDVIKEAERLGRRDLSNRPEQAAHYQDTADRATDRLEVGNASSKPLDETQAKEMAKEFKRDGDIDPDKYGLNSESFVEWSDIGRQVGEAALHAAALSAALSAAPHIWAVCREYFERGRIDPYDLIERGQAVLLGAGGAGLRGGVAAGLTAACKTGLMGQALKGVSPAAIGMATTLTLNVIDYSIKLQRGEISNQEFAQHCLRDTFVLSTGMLGATAGQMIIPIPVVGALVGNLVGATVGAVFFEGTNQVILGICVDSGWTFFGMVTQDFRVSEEVLRQAGYDVFCTHSFPVQSFSSGDFCIQSFGTNSLTFTPVRRGVIACNAVGYI